jgi:phage baseplate assembly protein W
MQINYPFSIDGRGRVASATEDEHIRQMIEQVIFTIPGERVNRPDFGSGIKQLIFSPNNNELAAATQFLVRGALEQWLGDVIQVEAIELVSDEERLYVTLQYVVRRSQQRQVTQFSREI